MTREITIEEVKKHKRKSSLWIIIHNDVYDVTTYLEEHPGGAEPLLNMAGKDGTQLFEDVGHSEDARELMKKYKIGTLPPAQHHKHVDICCKSKPRKKTSRSEHVKTDNKKSNFEPKAERRLGSIVVPSECTLPTPCRPRRFPCGGSNYKWLLLALAGAAVLGVVLKKYLAR